MNEEKLTFEQAYEKLKEAASKLDSDDVTLEEAMQFYEDGIKYYKLCSGILDEAKQKIELLDPDAMQEEITER